MQLLYIGNDPELSKASVTVLRAAGHKVRATNPLHANEALHRIRYGAVILCATLSAEEVDFVVRLVKQAQPEPPIVSLQVGMLGELPHPASSLVVDALLGPHAFVGAIHSLAVARKAP
jgi:hypothetical protein